jgi:small subunit ribosomal protein S17
MTNQPQQTPEAGAAPVRKALVQTFIGRVVSDKMNKTVTVLIERRVKHPLYGKIVIQSRKFHAHDENNECKTGDLVEIAATRKLSKTKAWRVAAVLEKAVVV